MGSRGTCILEKASSLLFGLSSHQAAVCEVLRKLGAELKAFSHLAVDATFKTLAVPGSCLARAGGSHAEGPKPLPSPVPSLKH